MNDHNLKTKNKAMTVLRSRLLKLKQQEENDKYAKERKDQVGTGDRSERIRTYNFPQSRITDHRINYTSHALEESLMGELDHIFDSFQSFLTEKNASQLCKMTNHIDKLTYGEVIRKSCDFLSKKQVPSSKCDAEWIVSHVSGKPRPRALFVP